MILSGSNPSPREPRGIVSLSDVPRSSLAISDHRVPGDPTWRLIQKQLLGEETLVATPRGILTSPNQFEFEHDLHPCCDLCHLCSTGHHGYHLKTMLFPSFYDSCFLLPYHHSEPKKERGKMPSRRVEATIPRKSLGTATGEDKVSWLMKEVREGA